MQCKSTLLMHADHLIASVKTLLRGDNTFGHFLNTGLLKVCLKSACLKDFTSLALD